MICIHEMVWVDSEPPHSRLWSKEVTQRVLVAPPVPRSSRATRVAGRVHPQVRSSSDHVRQVFRTIDQAFEGSDSLTSDPQTRLAASRGAFNAYAPANSGVKAVEVEMPGLLAHVRVESSKQVIY